MATSELEECRAALAELVALHNHPGAPCAQAFARRKRQAWARARRALGLPEEGTMPRNKISLVQAEEAFRVTRRNSEDIHD